MPCAAGQLCMMPNLTPEPPDGHRCRGGCGGRLHGVCGQVVEEDLDSDNPLRRICPSCSAGNGVSNTGTPGKGKAGTQQRGRGSPGQQHNPQTNVGSVKARTHLTPEQKLEMLELLAQKVSHAELARRFGCSVRTVSNVGRKSAAAGAADAAAAQAAALAEAAAAEAVARRATNGHHNEQDLAAAAVRKRRIAASAAIAGRDAQQARLSAAGMPCAAGEHCVVPTLTPWAPYGHECPGGCGGQLHGVCGEVVEVQEEEEEADGDNAGSSFHRVCPSCAATAKSAAAAAAAEAAVATAAAAASAAAAAAAAATAARENALGGKRKAGEDADGSGSGEPQAKLQKGTSKSRTQLSLTQKLEMLQLLTLKVSHAEISRRYKCALRTISNVAQNRAALEEEGMSSAGGRLGSSTRRRSAVFPEVDKRVLAIINASRKYKTTFTRAKITALGAAVKKVLLSTAKPPPPVTTTTTATTPVDKKKSLESFGASEKWAKSFVSRNGLAGRVIRGAGSGGNGGSGSGGGDGSVGIASASLEAVEASMKKVREECEKYEPENIFNVDEMSLFYKLLPKSSYLSFLAPDPTSVTAFATGTEGRQTARGTKDMGERDRVSAYVCTNSTGSAKVPMSMVGVPKNPKSFRGRACPINYFSQSGRSNGAWGSAGDGGATFREWWTQVFLPYVRRWTRVEVLCLVDACLPPPGGGWMEDPRGQVKVLVYPANCTGKHQPMRWGVIAATKLNYRRRLVSGRVSTMLAAGTLRAEARERGVAVAGVAGLAEGHPPHLLDAAEMLQAAWDDVSEATIARCWLKADTLPVVHVARSALSLVPGGEAADCALRLREYDDYSGVPELADALSALSAAVQRASARGSSSIIDPDLMEVLADLRISPGQPADQDAIAAARMWAMVEDREDVAEALRLDEQDAILSGTYGDVRIGGGGEEEGEEPGGGEGGEKGKGMVGGGDGGSAAKSAGSDGPSSLLPQPPPRLLSPPPSYAEVSPYLAPLEKFAEACGNNDAIHHLRKARMSFIMAHSSGEARRAHASSGGGTSACVS